jgi:hypothetical protein
MIDVDWSAVLEAAQADTKAGDSDSIKIARAVNHLYHNEVQICKTVAGYTMKLFVEYIAAELEEWAAIYMPALYSEMKKEQAIGGKNYGGNRSADYRAERDGEINVNAQPATGNNGGAERNRQAPPVQIEFAACT